MGNDGRNQYRVRIRFLGPVNNTFDSYRRAQVMAMKAVLLYAAVLYIKDFVQANRMFIFTHRGCNDVYITRPYPGFDLRF